MTLTEYIRASRGNATNLATALGVHKTQISNWANANPTPPPARCVQIEQATAGQVSRKDLRPDDWQAIWPELGPLGCTSHHGPKRTPVRIADKRA